MVAGYVYTTAPDEGNGNTPDPRDERLRQA
jgi:hypothetical protein